MIETVIYKIEGYNYYLKDQNNNEYTFNIKFSDIPKQPQIGDSLFLSSKILRESNSVLNFGSLTSSYGRVIKSENDPDVVVLVISGEKYFLKRLYG